MSDPIRQRYTSAAHAMQSGVAAEMTFNSKPTEPKHLRVGINAAMSDHAGLVQLLLDKGVITSEEYLTAIADSMDREVERYQEMLRSEYGAIVTLH